MTIKSFEDANAWQKHFDTLSPKLNEIAPDFTLSDQRGENSVNLLEKKGKSPVALVFGSFT